MKKRILCGLLALVLMVSLVPMGVLAEEVPTVTGSGILTINKYGNITLNMNHSDILNVFEYGDVVTVTIGAVSFDAPIVTAYTCVDPGQFGLFLQHEGEVEEVKLGINKGNFARDYGIAVCPDPENAPKVWEYLEGYGADMSYTITLKEKAAYREQFLLRSMEYTDAREEYSHLTDAQFGNFRPVVLGSIAPGVLYRSATPVNPKRNRNTYVDAAAQEAGVTVFVDLTDSEALLPDYEGYQDSWFASQKHIALNLTMDFSAEDNREKLAQGLRFMAENPGIYDIFCEEGKDRTGMVMALLEALMGASLEEICEDYMLSFYNYYGVEPDTEQYYAVLNGNLMKDIEHYVPENTQSPEAFAEAYLLDLGLTQAEIDALKTNLSTPVSQPEQETLPESTQEAETTQAQETVPETTAQPEEKPQSSTNTVILVLCILAGLAVGILIAPRLKKRGKSNKES